MINAVIIVMVFSFLIPHCHIILPCLSIEKFKGINKRKHNKCSKDCHSITFSILTPYHIAMSRYREI